MKQNGMRERKGRISRYGRRMLSVLLSTGMLLTGTLPVSGTENTEETARHISFIAQCLETVLRKVTLAINPGWRIMEVWQQRK